MSTGGDDGMQGRRGVVEGDLGDGAYLVKWSGMGSASEARRAEGRFLSRHSSQSHSTRMLNLYLLQVPKERCLHPGDRLFSMRRATINRLLHSLKA
jgi:hypothetical protein